ncbi:hypothetical protein ES703_123840 [subsurface metagenome]
MKSLGQSLVRWKGHLMLGIWIVIAIAVAYIILAGFLFIFQSRYVYYPERVLLADPGSIGLDFETVRFETTDGVKLSGWFIPSDSAKGVILFCHGNAGNLSHRLESIQIFHRLGLDVFIFDYRGYGESEGKPTENGTYEDAKAAWKYLIETRQVIPSQIIVFGRSLGGAVASWLAQSRAPGALILESTFTSLGDVAATLYPYLPVRLLLRFEYNTAEYLGGAVGSFFGLSALSELLGFLLGLGVLVAALTPWLGGLIFDLTASYIIAMAIATVLFAVAGLLSLLLRPPAR